MLFDRHLQIGHLCHLKRNMKNCDPPFVPELRFLCQRNELSGGMQTGSGTLGDDRNSKFWSVPQDFLDFFLPTPLLEGHRRVKNMNISDLSDFLFEILLISEVFQQEVKEETFSFPNLLELWEKLV